MSPTLRRRFLTVSTLVTAFLVGAVPASADAPGPTHYQSTVTGVETADGEPFDGVDFAIIGGDSYMVVDVPAGTVVEVPGYEGEPYIRIEADGTVQVNERSPARWLNDERYGEMDTEVPASADADAPPTWVESANNGQFAWHDHRIHFMSPSLPSQVDPSADTDQDVFDWEVPLLVDGENVTVVGDLVWVPGDAPILPFAGLALAVALLGFVVWTKPGASTTVILAGAAVTGAVGAAMQWTLPDGSDAEPAVIVLPAMAVVALVGGLVLLHRGDHRGGWLRDAAALPIGVWGLLQIGALTRPILPPPLPTGLARAVAALALAVGVVMLVALVRRVLRDTKLDSGTSAKRPGAGSSGSSTAPEGA